jgi:hypothetical protein
MVDVNISRKIGSKILINDDPHKKNDHSFNSSKSCQHITDSFIVLHQNICGLQNKMNY